ncbi:MAG: hypothetical protein JOY83_04875 [Alphaproteobacteria bacterium]|nr:hypothetical protein [Alphaproteobacteria bacterium]
MRQVVARAMADPATVLRQLGEPKRGGIEPLHCSPELTIINVLWPAGQVIMPHNHAMWAVIGVYTGREDNIVWRRLPDDINGRIEAAGAKTLGTKDVLSLGADAIHSVVNPLSRRRGTSRLDRETHGPRSGPGGQHRICGASRAPSENVGEAGHCG